MQYKLRRKLLSQNFIYNRTLISFLVRRSSVGKSDTVLEIGPGKGLITAEFLAVAKKVIAVEIDEKLIFHLKKVFKSSLNLEICHQNILDFSLPAFPYKVFANLPFGIESQVVRKLLDSLNPPEECYLIVDRRLANRLSGFPKESQFSLRYKPWFDFVVVYKFKESDFVPRPKVDGVMLKIIKKEDPELSLSKRSEWQEFVEKGFGMGNVVKKNLRKTITEHHWQKLLNVLPFSLKVKPGNLSYPRWLLIYEKYREIPIRYR